LFLIDRYDRQVCERGARRQYQKKNCKKRLCFCQSHLAAFVADDISKKSGAAPAAPFLD
jgi:hypothetical protein